MLYIDIMEYYSAKKKKLNLTICNYTDGTLRNHAKYNKSDIGRQIPHDPHILNLKKKKITKKSKTHRLREQTSSEVVGQGAA